MKLYRISVLGVVYEANENGSASPLMARARTMGLDRDDDDMCSLCAGMGSRRRESYTNIQSRCSVEPDFARQPNLAEAVMKAECCKCISQGGLLDVSAV